LNKESFDALLNWLNPEPELAAQKYEQIRHGLIKVFRWHGHDDAEDLADEVISRVVGRAIEQSKTYVGDPARYFYGVAKKVLLESSRRRPRPTTLSPNLETIDDFARAEENTRKERLDFCLEKCLQEQNNANRKLILRYYRENKEPKTTFRKMLANELAIDTNALRVRIYRIRHALKNCIEDCMREFETRETN
jgi:DNA-directed RNA polymerase specialized sigma24 family protein